MTRISRFIDELKRRNVFRSGVAYLVLAWFLVQVADILFDAFSAPEWVMQALIIALSLGLPATLVLAWVYEITTTGVQRTEDVSLEDSITYHTGRRLDFIIIGFLAVAVTMFALDRFVWEGFDDRPNVGTSSISLAVLPFHLGSDQIERLFGQLSNDLAKLFRRNSQLQLASGDAVDALPALSTLTNSASQLGVRFLVSGDLRTASDGLILSISLFDKEAEHEVWTGEFDRADLRQTIGVVAEKVMVEIGAESIQLPSAAIDPRAYESYLRARQLLAIEPFNKEAEKLFQEAIELDPRFAPALAGYCSFLVNRFSKLETISDFEEAERNCHRAWTIDEQTVEVHQALGDLYQISGQLKKARESYSAALAVSPTDLDTQVNMARTYRQDDPALAEIQLKRIVRQHPGSPEAHKQLVYLYLAHGRYAEAVEQQEWVVRLLPGSDIAKNNLSASLLLAGMFDKGQSLLLEMLESGSPDVSSIETNLATILFFEGDYAGAADLYRVALDRKGHEHTIYRNLGDAIWHLDGREASEPIFRDAIRLAEPLIQVNPDSVEAISTLMVSYASLGDSVRFADFKNRLLELYEANPQTHYDISVAASRLGKIKMSKVHAERSLELGYPLSFLKADPDIAASDAWFD